MVKSDINQQREKEKLLQRRDRGITSYFSKREAYKLQIGCGTNLINGWFNTDLEPISNEVYYLDVLELFPFENSAFDYVYSEHMIEHITYPQCLNMFNEVFRVLKPGGIFRVATPNIERLVDLFSRNKTQSQIRYIEWSANVGIGLYSENWSKLQTQRPEWAIDQQHFLDYYPHITEDSVCFIVNNFFRSYGHRFLFDAKSLRASLKSAGFIEITQHEIGESDYECLNGLETHGNLIGDSPNRYETLVMEGLKPLNQKEPVKQLTAE